MTTMPARRRHLSSSPFKAEPEPVILSFEMDELVSHDSYGMGRVVIVEPAAISVDFRRQIVRIPSPYPKMSKL